MPRNAGEGASLAGTRDSKPSQDNRLSIRGVASRGSVGRRRVEGASPLTSFEKMRIIRSLREREIGEI
jgi:hypothetical protein